MIKIYTLTLKEGQVIREGLPKMPTLFFQEKGTAMAIIKTLNEVAGKTLEWDFQENQAYDHQEALELMLIGVGVPAKMKKDNSIN